MWSQVGLRKHYYQQSLWRWWNPAELFQIIKDDAVKVLHSICQQIWKTQQWSQDWKRSVFIPIPKKGNAKQSSNYHTITLISHASKITLKILQARHQQYVNWEFSDIQAGFRKVRETRKKIANFCKIIDKAREFQKNPSNSASLTMLSLLLCGSTNCGKFSKRWEDQTTTCPWENCMQDKKTTVRTLHETTNWYKIGKGVRQSCRFERAKP